MDLRDVFQLVWRAKVLLLLMVGVSGQAMPVGFESGFHFFRAYPPAMSAFVQLVNVSLAYGNGLFGQEVAALPLISGGLGLRAAASVGQPIGLGLGFSVWQAATGTEGQWGGNQVSVSLSLSHADLHGVFFFSPWPDLLWLAVFAGMGSAAVHYSVDFPTTLALPFVPAVGEWTFRGRTFVAGAWARAALPLLPVLTVGVEAGYRWALFPGLFSSGFAMDLDQSGGPDALDLSGIWLGLSLRVEFSL